MQMQATAGYAGGQIPNPYMAYGAPDGSPPSPKRRASTCPRGLATRDARMPTVRCRLFAVSSLSSLC